MTSEAIRDPAKDHLLTPGNSAFIIIDYQPVQVNSIASMDRQLLINNICGAAKAAVAYKLPIIHSTVNVKTGLNLRPNDDQFVGRRRVPRSGREGRTQEVDHDGALDGSLPDLPGTRRLGGWV